MSLLTPDIGLLFWMMLSFLIVFGMLAKFGFPIITRMVDKRRAHIEEGVEAARQANEKLAGVEKEVERILDEAQKKHSEIVAAAMADRERIVESARQRADTLVAERMDAALSQIEIEKQKALGELRSTVATLSMDVAEKVLREKMSHSPSQEAYIQRLLDEVESDALHNS